MLVNICRKELEMVKKLLFIYILFFTLVFVYAQDNNENNKRLRYPSYPPNCCHNVITSNSGNSNGLISSLGVSFQGVPNVSNYGFGIKGTASPDSKMFFDFGASVGFLNFSLNPYTNICFLLPFDFSVIAGNWYAGIGISFLAGYDKNNNFSDSISYIAGSIITGFHLWDWLNISFTYYFGQNFSGEFFYDKFNYSVGYIYQFN